MTARAAGVAGLLWLAGWGTGCAPDPTRPGGTAHDSIHVAWQTALEPGTAGTRPYYHVAADGDRLYVPARGVAAYDLATGAPAWQAPPAGQPAENVVVSAGRVFASGSVARAFSAATGAVLWTFTPDTPAVALSAVDDRAFYIGTDARRVYALDVATGQPLWSTEAIAAGMYRAVVTGIVVSGDTVYASLVEDISPTGHLKRGWMVALQRTDGRVLWRYLNERPNEAHDVGRHAVAGRMLLLNDLNGGAFIGIDRFTGQEVWRHVGPRDRYGARDVFKVVDSVAYLASNDTHVYALDPQTGDVRWTREIGASASSSAVCGDYVFAAAGSLHMLDRATGQQRATLFLDREGFVLPDAFVVSRLVSHGNRVYFVGYKAVYAVDCSL